MKCTTYFFPLHYLTHFTATQNIDTISKQCFPEKLDVIEMVFDLIGLQVFLCKVLLADTAVLIYVDGTLPSKFILIKS